MAYASVNGLDIYYEIHGSGGTPLIVLPGGFMTVEAMGALVPELAKTRQIIGVELQGHGHTADVDRPLHYETMADDIAALIAELGLGQAAIMGFSLGGAVALRTAIQHPDAVSRLVLVSTVFARRGWYPEMTAGMDAMGPETAGHLRQTPLYDAYAAVAPNAGDWPVLVRQVAEVVKRGYDWSEEVRSLQLPVLLVVGDADGMPPSHAVDFFALLGGGQRDASWDRSGVTQHRLAILPGATHYDINVRPELADVVIPFLDGR
jgi:pimeloyl-ACP methyl ester carboxylesterase